MEELRGRSALVTGSSRGIGAAIAQAYAGRGMRVAVHYGKDEAGARQTLASLPGQGHALVQADVSDPEAVRRMVDDSAAALGGLDVLVNNAGIHEYHPFLMEDYQEWQSAWRRALNTNLVSAANATWCALRVMRAQGGGKVINVASRAGFRGEADAPAYAASKSGMMLLTRSIARALSQERILSYAIAPGWVETAMARQGMAMMRERIEGEIPVGRIATVEDVAGVALFLATDAANYLTGITIDVNGGSYLR